MARAHGIQSHPIFKLGKAKVKHDKRNLLFTSVLKATPKLPAEYDFDLTHTGIPMPMFGNDVHGDCVIAGRAHQTLRFEDIEQSSVLMIKDSEVLKEYFKETGGPDSGLVVLDSLNEWRQQGWKAAGKKYFIKAFTQLALKDHTQIKTAIYLDVGVGLGLSLPLSAQEQVQTGKPWDVVGGPNGAPGSWGGHYVFVPGYTKLGPVCVTWGKKQQMTWKFFDKYCDEAYAIFDSVDTAKKKKAIDAKKLNAFLKAL
jgi:hypothetical protein